MPTAYEAVKDLDTLKVNTFEEASKTSYGTIAMADALETLCISLEQVRAFMKSSQYQSGATITDIICGHVERQNHTLFRHFYPRIYQTTGQYHSPKKMAAMLTVLTAECQELYRKTGRIDSIQTAYRLVLPALNPMVQKRMPTFFLSPELLKAVQTTDFTDDIEWGTFALPYEHGVIMLPRHGFGVRDHYG